jgi:hypothetical protein
VIDAAVESVLAMAYEHVQGGRPMMATDTLVQQLDRWLVEGEIEHVRLALEKLDPSRCPPEVLTGVLSLTWHAKERLPTRGAFFERAMEALDRIWGLPSERLAMVAERLR